MRPLPLLAAAVLTAACVQAPALGPEPETPPELSIARLTFEQRRDGEPIWQGAAAAGRGDLAALDLTDLTLTQAAQAAGPTPPRLAAPSARCTAAAGGCMLRQATLHLNGGQTLSAPAATFVEAAARIDAEGPVRLRGDGLSVDARRAVLELAADRLNIEGPVTGQLQVK